MEDNISQCYQNWSSELSIYDWSQACLVDVCWVARIDEWSNWKDQKGCKLKRINKNSTLSCFPLNSQSWRNIRKVIDFSSFKNGPTLLNIKSLARKKSWNDKIKEYRFRDNRNIFLMVIVKCFRMIEGKFVSEDLISLDYLFKLNDCNAGSFYFLSW